MRMQRLNHLVAEQHRHKFNLWGAALDFFVVLVITAIIAKCIENKFRGRILWQFRWLHVRHCG